MAFPVVCRLPHSCAHELSLIDQESNRPPWTPTQFAQEFLHSFSHVYGIRSGGKIAGFLVVHIAADEAHIVNFAIRKANRGHGLGRQLLSSVLRELDALAVRTAVLEVRVSNHPARALYEQIGFAETGLRRGYYTDDAEDGIMMSIDVREFVQRYEQLSAANR